jgi:excisionase family DNA binding protein
MGSISTSSLLAADTVRTPAPSEDEDLTLLTVDEVAALLKVSKSWVYERTRSHRGDEHALPFVKLGKYLRFDERDIRAYIARQRDVRRLRRSR